MNPTILFVELYSLLISYIMEKYKITKTLGDGSFGTVFKAINIQENEVVAIKKMK